MGRDVAGRPVTIAGWAQAVLATRPRAVLGGAVALVVLVVVLALSVGSAALTAPEAPDPVKMTPARAVAPPSQPGRGGAARPVAPKPATRTPPARSPAKRTVPKRVPVEDATGQAYQNGMDMARRAAGGNPWSGLVP